MFYDNFDKLCTKIGTSPTAFTKNVLGLSTSKVTAWKNGSLPKYEILQKIADVFDCSVGALFDGDDIDVLCEKNNAPNDVRSAIIARVKALPDDRLDRLLGYLEALAAE